MRTLSDLIRRVHRRARLAIGAPCQDPWEINYRVNRLQDPVPAGSTFSFPWGIVEYLSASDLRGQYYEIYLKRHYAFKTTEVAPTIIDAGANVGMSVIWFKQTYPGSRITAYEADPMIAAILSRNLKAAAIDDVQVQQAAVWDHDGSVSFDDAGSDKGAISAQGGASVPCIDLSRHLPERVDMLKMDIEGAEYAVIEKLSRDQTLRQVQNISAEYHIQRHQMDQFLDSMRLLRDSGMEVAFTADLGPHLGLAPLEAALDVVGREQMLAQVYAWRQP
jgi:FkbM family methyltransferase